MAVKSASHQFRSSFSYFRDKIDCVKCNPALKDTPKFHLCPECKKYFTNKGIVGLTDFNKTNDAFKYIIYVEHNEVFRGKILGCGGGLCYDPFLKNLDKSWFYNPIRIEKEYDYILEEIFNIDYNDHHFLVDFQDNSDEPLF